MPRPKLPLLVFTLLLTTAASAQSPACQAPVLKPLAPGTNLFNDKQEMEFSGILHRGLEQDMKMIEDESLTGELQKVADRLAHSFPNTGIKFRLYIYDLPEANAFSEPGGNIYFSRKLIAFFRTEDELAGVMAHEMGHIVTHQRTIAISREMREVLGVKELGDADDVEEKYNQLLDSYGKKPGAFHRNQSESHEQGDADQVAVFALGTAGYDVKTLPAFWDRFSENKGKKGNFFRDMFGATTEEQRRFRDMLKNAAAVAPECVGKRPPTSQEDFKKWQSAVLTYSGIGHPERLDALIERKALTPPLRPELTRLHISPDGKYVLAQDPASIAVLNRADLKPLFRIDADEARSVQFTQDSQSITFYTLRLFSSPRIEIWDIADHSMRAAYELRIPNGCNQAALSADGKYFACVFPNIEASVNGSILFDLRVLKTDTGEIAFEKKAFFDGDIYSTWVHLWRAIRAGEELQVVSMHFSPDSKYLLCGRRGMAFAVEAATGAKLNLPDAIRDIMQVDFAFLDGGRIAGGAGAKGDKGAVAKFPSGEIVYSNLKMGLTHVEGAAHGEFLLLYPLKDYAAGIFDLKKNDYIIGSKDIALDIYDDEFVHQRGDGELGASELATRKERRSMPLEDGPLGRVVAGAASDDLKFLAISGTVRGAVWNLDQGTRLMHFRRFNGVGVDNSGVAFADFPAEGDGKRQFAQINTAKGVATSFPAEEGVILRQAGAYLVEWIPVKKDDWKKKVTFQVRSMRNNLVLWTRMFPNGAPLYFVEDDIDSLVFAYDVSDPSGKNAMQGNDELRAKVQSLKTREHAYAVESVDLKTGKTDNVMAIDTGKGSFELRDAFRAGQYLVTTDSNDRVQVFGFDGVRRGRLQSHMAMGSRDGKLLAVTIGSGKLAIYDLEKFKQVDELDFPARLAIFRFSADSSRLLVVTRDQKAYYFDTKALHRAEQVAATTH